MKTTKHLFTLLLLCVALTSCHNPKLSEEYALELASYLTDNYTVGDTVLFTTETGETDSFVVKWNEYRKEYVEPETRAERRNPDVSYRMYTNMESTKNKFEFESAYYVGDGKIVDEVWFLINREYSQGAYAMTITGDTLHITSADYDCIMKKNVGVVRVSNKEHSWTLKE